MLIKALKVIRLIVGIGFLIIMAVFTFELAYTLLNPHMFYTAKSMAEMMMVIVPSGIIGFLLVNFSIKGREKQILFQKITLWVLLAFYGAILFAILFGSGIAPRTRLSSMPDSFRFRVSTSNFIPFKTIASYIKGFFSNTVSGYIANNNLMGNLVLFMPMGIFLPALFKSSRLKHCLIVFIGLILVEVLQLVTGCGVFDIDDIILNFVGFFLVYSTMRAKFMEKIKEKLCIWI